MVENPRESGWVFWTIGLPKRIALGHSLEREAPWSDFFYMMVPSLLTEYSSLQYLEGKHPFSMGKLPKLKLLKLGEISK